MTWRARRGIKGEETHEGKGEERISSRSDENGGGVPSPASPTAFARKEVFEENSKACSCVEAQGGSPRAKTHLVK